MGIFVVIAVTIAFFATVKFVDWYYDKVGSNDNK